MIKDLFYSWDNNEEEKEENNICRGKNCKHILRGRFCPNPDCFYHKNSQSKEEEVHFFD